MGTEGNWMVRTYYAGREEPGAPPMMQVRDAVVFDGGGEILRLGQRVRWARGGAPSRALGTVVHASFGLGVKWDDSDTIEPSAEHNDEWKRHWFAGLSVVGRTPDNAAAEVRKPEASRASPFAKLPNIPRLPIGMPFVSEWANGTAPKIATGHEPRCRTRIRLSEDRTEHGCHLVEHNGSTHFDYGRGPRGEWWDGSLRAAWPHDPGAKTPWEPPAVARRVVIGVDVASDRGDAWALALGGTVAPARPWHEIAQERFGLGSMVVAAVQALAARRQERVSIALVGAPAMLATPERFQTMAAGRALAEAVIVPALVEDVRLSWRELHPRGTVTWDHDTRLSRPGIVALRLTFSVSGETWSCVDGAEVVTGPSAYDMSDVPDLDDVWASFCAYLGARHAGTDGEPAEVAQRRKRRVAIEGLRGGR